MDLSRLRAKLDDQRWPRLYMFKFIVKPEKAPAVEALFTKTDVQARPSRNGRYVSLTAKLFMPSSDAVIGVYEKAARIEGLIAL